MCQYFGIIYKINYTDSNNYTLSKKHRENLFCKTELKKRM